jgi:predicted transcriptional regulator
MLKKGRMTAGDIGRRFNMAGATISYHLSQLKKAGLVFETRHKNFIIYELDIPVFEEAIFWLAQFKGEKSDEIK